LRGWGWELYSCCIIYIPPFSQLSALIENGIVYGNGVRGFTLVELLVVIAVIAIIVAIQLPAVLTAHRHAQKVVCELQRNSITRYDEDLGLRVDIPVPVLARCYECHIPNRYRQP